MDDYDFHASNHRALLDLESAPTMVQQDLYVMARVPAGTRAVPVMACIRTESELRHLVCSDILPYTLDQLLADAA